jgi:taurine dioxygenase
MEVQPLEGSSFGAEVVGIDLSQPLDGDTKAALDQALAENYILWFRNQSLEPEHVVEASRVFGPVEPHVTPGYYHPDTDLLLVLSNQKDATGTPLGIKDAGTFWHSDVSYRACPAKATMLYAIETPEEGGDTLFCDMVAALETLPPELRAKLEGRHAMHHYAQRDKIAAKQGTTQVLNAKSQENTPPVRHPALRTHPATGRTSLYVCPAYTTNIEGLNPDDSEDTLARIYDHCLQDQFRLRYKWRPGDVVVWENVSVMHSATTQDLPPDRARTLWRTVISGEPTA